MAFSVESEHLNGLVVLRTDLFSDDRGHFLETFREDKFSSLGIPTKFIQDNQSRSKKGVIRGLHFQFDPPQGKLVRVSCGRAFLGIADIRKNSPTFGKWFGREFTDTSGLLIWIPAGFANGFCAISDTVDIHYKCTALYSPSSERSIRWNDPDIGIRWPVESPIVSRRDASALSLSDWIRSPESDVFAGNK